MNWHWLLLALLLLGLIAHGMTAPSVRADDPEPAEPLHTDAERIEAAWQPIHPEIALTSLQSTYFTITNDIEISSSTVRGDMSSTQQIHFAVPQSYDASQPTPLVVALHGYAQPSADMLSLAVRGMDTHPTARNWLVVAPEMRNRSDERLFQRDLPGYRAFASVEAQHDVIDAIRYMQENYNVDTSRVYVIGLSMGGLTTLTVAAKYPDIFAAAVPWKPITDLSAWYDHIYDNMSDMEIGFFLDELRHEIDLECRKNDDPDEVNGCGTPASSPFEYERRSPMQMPSNLRLMPITIWHDEVDRLVPYNNSVQLRDELVNTWGADTFDLRVVNTGEICHAIWQRLYNREDENLHCYDPPPMSEPELDSLQTTIDGRDLGNVFDFLEQHTLPAAPPAHLHIRTDESKPYYWLNVAQNGDTERWTEAEATFEAATSVVSATIQDTHPLTVGFNLGSDPVQGAIAELPGLGMPADTYLVQAGEQSELVDYTTGYLNVGLDGASTYAVTIAPISATIGVEMLDVRTASIVVNTADVLGNVLPDGTPVEFATTLGSFSGELTTTVSLSGGEASTTLMGGRVAGTAEVRVSIGQYQATTEIALEAAENTPPTSNASGKIRLNRVSTGTEATVHTLSDYFTDAEDDSETLTYTLVGNTNSDLFTDITIVRNEMTLAYAPDTSGSAELTIRATDSGQFFVENTFIVTVEDSANVLYLPHVVR
jgi:predicted esterase